MIKQFFNIQNIVSILACVGVFFMATKIESCQNAKELNRLDKKISSLQEQRNTDSTKIVNADAQILNLQQSVDAGKDNDKKHQMNAAELTKQRNEALAEAKRATAAIEHYEENDLIRYFVFDKKGIFKKGCYEEVFKKPDNICK